MKMEDLSALMPRSAVTTSPVVFQQIGCITRMLLDTLEQHGVVPELQIAAEGLPGSPPHGGPIKVARPHLNEIRHTRSGL